MSELNKGITQRDRAIEDARNDAISALTTAYQRVSRIQGQLNNALFNSGFESADLFVILGDKAKIYVKFNELLIDALEVIAVEDGVPPTSERPPYNYVKNPDGTVTVDKLAPFNPTTKKGG